jgi:hypothetical protein
MDNILVRVMPQNYNATDDNPPYSTIMVSAHYDTVTYSSGAYDDTVRIHAAEANMIFCCCSFFFLVLPRFFAEWSCCGARGFEYYFSQ